MDFDLTPEQLAISELASRLLGDKSTPAAIRAVELASPERFDRELWAAMADAGLLGLVVPEEYGGAGLGVIELCIVLEEVGRRTAAVPALAALALGALPLARFGTDAQKAALLPGVADGSLIVTTALTEPLGDVFAPTLSAHAEGGDWVLDGTRTNVPAGLVADTILVPANTTDGVAVFIVDAAASGLTRTPQETTSGTLEAHLTFDVVRVSAESVLGSVGSGSDDSGSDVLSCIVEHGTVASCAVMAGVAAEAVRLTGEYTTAREQFGRPIASFQAVTQRAADAYVDSQGIELTMLQAAWRLGAGLPADREIAVAKYWAAAGGQRVVHAAQHLHGGTGVDRDYPLHRYFLLAKQLELFLGGATRQLLRLGAILADQGAVR